MNELTSVTKGGSEGDKKPKVYFSCHPDDFEKTFEEVCRDIFGTHDCIIYRRVNMREDLPEETRDMLLSMNLFVFPVTYAMLTDENLPVRRDLDFAAMNNLTILPIMFEHPRELDNFDPVILELYNKMFGERQYLSRYSKDHTEINYSEKLKKYLESVLISPETAERIRREFDAYIFLSYRKKDRKYANEIMKLIHSDPACRDIAVWYDEYLTPGESFNSSIAEAMKKSRMITLLVTPSLLEPGYGGGPNYVEDKEYPEAKASGKPIFPAEKVHTDRPALAESYEDLPAIIDANDEKLFHDEFMNAVSDIAKHEKADDPIHNYLIGLAYLTGTDVEIEPEYCVGYITKAAEAGLPEAMKKLYDMYNNGMYVAVDIKKANYWAEKLYRYYLETYGPDDDTTLGWMDDLSRSFTRAGEFTKALEYDEMCYEARRRLLGDHNKETLKALNGFALSCQQMGKLAKALELLQKCYEGMCSVLGEEHPDTLVVLGNIALVYSDSACLKKVREEKKAAVFKRKALEIGRKCYDSMCRVLGRDHPDTLMSLERLAYYYYRLGDLENALEITEECFNEKCRALGEGHPSALSSLNSAAVLCRQQGDYDKALELQKKCCMARIKALGEYHPDVAESLENIAHTFISLKEYSGAAEFLKKSYDIRCRVFGKEHYNTVTLYKFYIDVKELAGLLSLCEFVNDGDLKSEKNLRERICSLKKTLHREDDQDTLNELHRLAYICGQLGDNAEAAELYEKCYKARCKVLGADHPDTLQTLGELRAIRQKMS